ncbi:MAG: hypothetical protein V8S95_00110 [Odoribacter sp.]
MINLVERIRRSEVISHVLTLSTGSIIAQLIPILASLILARLYSPEDFGTWGIFSSYATMLAIIGGGRYEAVIVHAKRRVDAINLFVLSVLILCLLSFVFLLLIGSADLFAWNVFRNVSGKYFTVVSFSYRFSSDL